MQQEKEALIKASFREDELTGTPAAGCVMTGLYDVRPGVRVHANDMTCPPSVCFCLYVDLESAFIASRSGSSTFNKLHTGHAIFTASTVTE